MSIKKYFNNSNFYNMEEKEKIKFSLSKLINNKDLFDSMKVNYNFNYKINNKSIELDALVIFKTSKINFIIFEFKHYRDKFCIYDTKNDDIYKKYNQILEFKNDIINNLPKNSVDFYLVFSNIYNDNNCIEYITLKIENNFDINIDNTDDLLLLLNNSNIKFFNEDIIQNIKTTPRDINYLIDSFKNPDKFKNIFDSRISSNIYNSKEKIFLINGEAGSGKTNLACALYSKLLSSNVSTLLFLINYKFLDEIKSNLKKNNLNLLTYNIVGNSIDFENHNIWNNKDEIIIIIDEYQRLNYKNLIFIREILKNKKVKFILFGDEMQTISTYDQGIKFKKLKNICKQIKLNNKNYRMPFFDINYLIYIFAISNNEHKITNLNLNIFTKKNDFIKKFQIDNNWKIMTTLLKYNENGKQSFFNIDFLKNIKMQKAPKEISISSQNNKKILSSYYFSVYDTISREIESMYLFIPKNTYCMFSDPNDINKIKEQIYINLTRATKEINVYIDDEEYLKIVQKRIKTKNNK